LLDASYSSGLFSAQPEAQILAAEFAPAVRGVKYGDRARRIKHNAGHFHYREHPEEFARNVIHHGMVTAPMTPRTGGHQ
jgi:hypothetical protein